MAKPLVSDELWAVVAPLLPPPRRDKLKSGRPRVPDRAALAGILFVLNGPETPSWTGLAVGAASAALIGGLFGFLVSSFLSVGLCALHEACGGRRATRPQDE